MDNDQPAQPTPAESTDTTLTHATPSAVQLPEALRTIPRDARLVVEEGASATYWPIGAMAHGAADEIDRLTKPAPVAIPLLLNLAVDNCLLAGNHVASLTDGEVPYTATTTDALRHYGHGQAFDIWVTWRGIMLLRDAWDAWMAQVNPPPANTRPSTM